MSEERIVVDSDVVAGKPVIKGTRVPVYVVLEMLEADNSIDDILDAYPDLKREDVKAAISYATSIVQREDYDSDTSSVA